MKRLAFIFCLIPSLGSALEEKPWYPDFMEFNAIASYNYNFFDEVDRGVPQLDQTIQSHIVTGGIELTAPPCWNWQAELELEDTTQVSSFGYRSFALSVRTLWLDDICGDPVSLSTGISYRDASSKFRRSLGTPYHGRANFEFHTSVGKEWSSGPYWFFRTYAVAAVGQATSGSPWLRGDLFFWWNFKKRHQFRIYERSYFGLGSQETVPTLDFEGWGDIRHQSIDLGVSYRYRFECYGSLRFDYLYRVYARSYPEKVNFFVITFKYPFCPF